MTIIPHEDSCKCRGTNAIGHPLMYPEVDMSHHKVIMSQSHYEPRRLPGVAHNDCLIGYMDHNDYDSLHKTTLETYFYQGKGHLIYIYSFLYISLLYIC